MTIWDYADLHPHGTAIVGAAFAFFLAMVGWGFAGDRARR